MKSEELRERLVFVAGMLRSGTTFLYHNLQRHPEVFAPTRKETAYFAYNFDEGSDWFASFYSGMKNERIALDVCGVYSMDERALDRILEFKPNAKVVLGVRDPVDWVYSMYGHYDSKFSVPPFCEFLEGCTIDREGKHYRLEFIDGKIERTIRRFSEKLGDNLFIYDFNVLERDALSLMKALEDFFELSPYFAPGNFDDAKINVRGTGSESLLGRLVLRVPGLATLVSKVMPRSAIMYIRRRMEVAPADNAASKTKQTKDATLTEDDRAVAQSVLANDKAFVDQLFLNGPFVRGTSVKAGHHSDR